MRYRSSANSVGVRSRGMPARLASWASSSSVRSATFSTVASGEAGRAGIPLDLTPTEFALLRYLMANPGTVLSKAKILDKVWGYASGSDGAIVETYMSYLRRKVDTPFGAPLLHTKRGIGYVLKEPS